MLPTVKVMSLCTNIQNDLLRNTGYYRRYVRGAFIVVITAYVGCYLLQERYYRIVNTFNSVSLT